MEVLPRAFQSGPNSLFSDDREEAIKFGKEKAQYFIDMGFDVKLYVDKCKTEGAIKYNRKTQSELVKIDP